MTPLHSRTNAWPNHDSNPVVSLLPCLCCGSTAGQCVGPAAQQGFSHLSSVWSPFLRLSSSSAYWVAVIHSSGCFVTGQLDNPNESSL